MGVAMSARVLGVCLVALPLGAAGEEGEMRGVRWAASTPNPSATASPDAAPTAASTAASTAAPTPPPTATASPATPRTPTATPATAASPTAPSRSGTAMASATSTATSVPASASSGRQPPPAVLMVPLLGGVILPVVVPTAVPHPRREGASAKEKTP